MSFIIDNRILSTCFELGDWPLSRVFLKNNANYPWFILVPRLENIREIYELSQQQGYLLIDEINQLSSIVQAYFKPNKLNISSLGNIVSQMHIHIVARFINDKLWPHSIWQADQETTPYKEQIIIPLLNELRHQIQHAFDTVAN